MPIRPKPPGPPTVPTQGSLDPRAGAGSRTSRSGSELAQPDAIELDPEWRKLNATTQGDGTTAGTRRKATGSTSRAKARAKQIAAQQGTREARRPSIEALYQDPQFKALYDFVIGSVRDVEHNHREWDKLEAAKRFAAAASFVTKNEPLPGVAHQDGPALLTRFNGVQERRAMCHLLLLLMPPDDRCERPLFPDGSRGQAQELFRPFPDAVLERADEKFALLPGDLPHINPFLLRHLAQPDLLDTVFRPGQQGLFLASKKFCPGAFVQDRADKNPPALDKRQQSGHEGDPIMVRIDDILVVDGKKMARVHVPPQHKVWLGDGGACVRGDEVLPRIDVVLDKTGRTQLDQHGEPKPILIPVDHLASYLLADGDGARTLDFARAEDRALALVFMHTLKESRFRDSNGYEKSLFEWLEQADHRTPRHDVDRIRELVRQAAFFSVVRYSTHPRRTHFALDVDPQQLKQVRSGRMRAEDADWQVQAFLALDATGIMRDQGNYYEKDKSSTTHVHELAWTGELLKNGFIGGSLDCLGSSDAFDALAKTFLEPLGILSTTGIAEGHGASLMRVLGQPDDDGMIQAGVPMKVKPNELIVGLEMPLSSGRGPAAQYMENWGGYLRIDGVVGERVDFEAARARLDALLETAP